METTPIIKGTKSVEAAKKLADWATSLKANEMYGKYYAIVANPTVTAFPVNYPLYREKLMAKMDVEWMAKNRERILAEWTKRYDGKSAPKEKRHTSRFLTSTSATATSPRSAISVSISPRASSSASWGHRAAARPPCCAPSP